MAAFTVKKVYYIAHRDLIVLSGALESGVVRPGDAIDLPREIKGPGWVPIHDVQQIPFLDGRTELGIVLLWDTVTGAPLMEFSALEGLALQIRPGTN
jgi:hypothetical protein